MSKKRNERRMFEESYLNTYKPRPGTPKDVHEEAIKRLKRGYRGIIAERILDGLRRGAGLPDKPMSPNRVKYHASTAITHYNEAVEKGEWPVPVEVKPAADNALGVYNLNGKIKGDADSLRAHAEKLRERSGVMEEIIGDLDHAMLEKNPLQNAWDAGKGGDKVLTFDDETKTINRRITAGLGSLMGDRVARADAIRTLEDEEENDYLARDPWSVAWRAQPSSQKVLARLEQHKLRADGSQTEEAQRIVDGVYGAPPPGWKHAFGGLADAWSDQCLMQVGLTGWNAYRRDRGLSLEEALDASERDLEGLYEPDSHKSNVARSFAHFSIAWADTAFQKIVTTHTYAAAMMCSDASRDAVEDIEIQWKAFMVAAPNGMLVFEGEDGRTRVDYTRILVHVQNDGRTGIILFDPTAPPGTRGRMMGHVGATLADMLYDEPGDFETREGYAPAPNETRVLMMAKRLVAGLLLSMQHQDNFKSRTSEARYGKKSRELEEPAHRITVIGKPLKVDCRASVARYIATGTQVRKGTGKSAFQILVRGHFKRQVMGVGRSLRKVIWIKPFYRGDENAPILTRPKLVDGGTP